MQWWQWAFDGIGAGIVIALLGFLGRRLFVHDRARRERTQSIRSGKNSVNVQAGRDAKTGDFDGRV